MSIMNKNMKNKTTVICLMFICNIALAEDYELSVVPTLDVGMKQTNFEFSVQGSGYSKHSYTTLAPALAVGYGPFYVLAVHDFTINNSRVTEAGSPAAPVLSSRDYERGEDSITLGYSIGSGWSGFFGILKGRSDFFETVYDTSNPGNTVTTISAFTFNESGYYFGANYNRPMTPTGSFSGSIAYGNMNGTLDYKEASGLSVFESDAPGYSLSAVWTAAVSDRLNYRIGVKQTSYDFDISKVTVNGVEPATSGDLFFKENITNFFFGLSGFF
jgi:hypothetical protein